MKLLTPAEANATTARRVGLDVDLGARPSRLTAVMAWTAAIGERIDDHAEQLEEGG